MSRTSDRKISDIMSDFLGASWRATVRLPPRKDISRVYLVVGYTTKKYVEERYNAERRMMIMRRGLLALIFFLLLFIVLDRSLSAFNYGEIKQMFGFSSWSELLKNDPFSERKETAPTAPVQPTTVSTAAENKTET